MKKILFLASCFMFLASSLPVFAGSLPYRVVIEKEEAEEAPLRQIKEALVQAKVDGALAKAALTGFDGYIDQRIEKEKKTVTLYPQTIFEIAQSAAVKGWSGGDISQLLIYIQKEIDNEGRSATKSKAVAVVEINKGKNLKEIINALEAGEGDDD